MGGAGEKESHSGENAGNVWRLGYRVRCSMLAGAAACATAVGGGGASGGGASDGAPAIEECTHTHTQTTGHAYYLGA